MTHRIWLLGALLLVACARPAAFTDSAAYQSLRTAPAVESARVGYAGDPSVNAEAFRALLDRGDAATAFAQLLNEATPAGQMYALAGLYLTDRAVFEEVSERYRGDDREVEVRVGDVIAKASLAAIVGFDSTAAPAVTILNGDWPRSLAEAN